MFRRTRALRRIAWGLAVAVLATPALAQAQQRIDEEYTRLIKQHLQDPRITTELVDAHIRTSGPDLYAAGDCADAFHVVTGQRTWIPLALRANRAGWAVADNVLEGKVELQGVAGTAVFKVFDLEVARTGLSVEEARKAGFEPAEVAIQSQSKGHKYPGTSVISVQLVGDKKSGRLLGAQMVGKEGAAHRINAPAVALHAKMSVEDFGQSDLAYAPPFGPSWGSISASSAMTSPWRRSRSSPAVSPTPSRC